jgi:hypothetical protein
MLFQQSQHVFSFPQQFEHHRSVLDESEQELQQAVSRGEGFKEYGARFMKTIELGEFSTLTYQLSFACWRSHRESETALLRLMDSSAAQTALIV